MDTEELRTLVLDWLNQNIEYPSMSFKIITDSITAKIIQKNYSSLEPKLRNNLLTSDNIFHEDRGKIRQIIWELIIQGILVPGLNEDHPNLPGVSLTDYGKKVVSVKEAQPHDPDEFLKFVKQEIPTLDEEIERYLAESLQAYRRDLMLSSAVTLGVASEKALLILLESLIKSFNDSNKKKKFIQLQAITSQKKKFNAVKKEILSIKPKLPRTIQENMDTYLEGIFNVIRVTRNEAGHPTGRIIKRDEAFVNLRIFVHYLKKVYQIIEWLNNNSI